MSDTTWEAPTLEGRALCDLGQQLAAMRAERDAARAEVARLREALDGRVCPGVGGVTLREMVQAIRQDDSYPVIYADFVAEALAEVMDAALAAKEGA